MAKAVTGRAKSKAMRRLAIAGASIDTPDPTQSPIAIAAQSRSATALRASTAADPVIPRSIGTASGITLTTAAVTSTRRCS